MQKRTLRAPFFVVNPKAYLYGDQALALAKVADELSGTNTILTFYSLSSMSMLPESKRN